MADAAVLTSRLESLSIDDASFIGPLNEEDAKRVALAFEHGPDDVLVESTAGWRVTRSDLQRLRGETWLNDEVVNLYFHLIGMACEGSGRNVHLFNSFFYTKLTSNGYDYSAVRRWTRKKTPLLSRDIVLVPVHKGGNHWVLGCIWPQRRLIEHYDSMRGADTVTANLLRYIEDEAQDKSQEKISREDWVRNNVSKLPSQGDGGSCGVFMSTFAELIAAGTQTFEFDQSHIPIRRKRMALNLLNMSVPM